MALLSSLTFSLRRTAAAAAMVTLFSIRAEKPRAMPVRS